jgi:hypothetical protein
VPDNVFIDARTNLMWTRTLVVSANGTNFRQVTWAGPFANFVLPTLGDLAGLADPSAPSLVARKPDEGHAAWLRRTANIAPGMAGRIWASDSLQQEQYEPPFLCKRGYGIPCSRSTRRQLHWFNLTSGKVEKLCERVLQCPILGSANEPRRLGGEKGLVVFKRPIPNGESYWFQ